MHNNFKRYFHFENLFTNWKNDRSICLCLRFHCFKVSFEKFSPLNVFLKYTEKQVTEMNWLKLRSRKTRPRQCICYKWLMYIYLSVLYTLEKRFFLSRKEKRTYSFFQPDTTHPTCGVVIGERKMNQNLFAVKSCFYDRP